MYGYEFDEAKYWGKIVAGIALGGLVLFGGCTAITNNWQCSEGQRVGMVNKISKKGLIWKTYEGQMALEGIASDGKSVGANVWDFAIDNYDSSEKQSSLVKQLQESMDSGDKVKIKYKEMVCTWPWRSGSGHLIQEIEPISKSRTQGYPAGIEMPEKQESRTSYEGKGQLEVNLDGRNYLLKHDKAGKLKVSELREVQ